MPQRPPLFEPVCGTARRRHQSGLTLVELMVALTLGLLIALASVAALIIARQGFSSVDTSTQLRENTRFAASVIQRVVIQAGFDFQVVEYGRFDADKQPGLQGFDNALLPALTALPGGFAHDDRDTRCGAVTATSCVNRSDVLIVRYSGASRKGSADGSIINCAGVPEPEPTAAGSVNWPFSIFHVARDADGEPTLACTYRNPATNAWATTALVRGVEAFRVLYGVDGVEPGIDAGNAATGTSVADRYLRASQLDAPAGVFAVNNWHRVRSVRVGLLLRGDPGTALERKTATFDVLGKEFVDPADELRNRLTAPADGRLRLATVFTVHLRNQQFSVPEPVPVP